MNPKNCNSATEFTENTKRNKMKTTPIPTFPLRGKEAEGKIASESKSSLPIRGRARVGVV
jgi:hypothetical protein